MRKKFVKVEVKDLESLLFYLGDEQKDYEDCNQLNSGHIWLAVEKLGNVVKVNEEKKTRGMWVDKRGLIRHGKKFCYYVYARVEGEKDTWYVFAENLREALYIAQEKVAESLDIILDAVEIIEVALDCDYNYCDNHCEHECKGCESYLPKRERDEVN